MSRAIAVCNQKGGVGKTTTAVNLSACLAIMGKRVLLIDLDPQASATVSSGADRTNCKKTSYDVLVDGATIQDALVATSVKGLDLVPASLELAKAELRLTQLDEPDTAMRKACEAVREQYEAIFFDCPPSLGVLTSNALVAAEAAVIPVQCEYLALEGLSALVQAIEMVRSGRNPALEIAGIVLTMTDFRSNLAREVAEEVKRFFPGKVFETAIPRNIRVAESPSFGKPVCVYEPHSTGSMAYQLLAEEVAKRLLDKGALEAVRVPSGAAESPTL